MKRFQNLFSIMLIASVILSCKNETAPEVKTVAVETTKTEKVLNPDALYAKAEFGIDGMTCAIGCAKTIEKKLAKMDGVKSAKVDFDRELAMVEYDEAMVTPATLSETVTKVADAYTVKDMKTVKEFSTTCTMACCEGKTAEEKASCNMACCKADKKQCAEDCKKDCCAKKA